MDGVTLLADGRHLCMVNFYRLAIFLNLFFLPVITWASGIEGVVMNGAREPLGYAQIGIAGKNASTQTNAKGEYRLDLAPGEVIIQVYLLGYLPYQDTLVIHSGKPMKYNITLVESFSELTTIEVVANGRDLAKEVISKAIDRKDYFVEKRNTYTCEVLYKEALERQWSEKDTLFEDSIKRDLVHVDIDHLAGYVVQLVRSGKRTEQRVKAYTDFKATWEGMYTYYSRSFEYGDPEPAPDKEKWENPYLLKSEYAYSEFNLDQNAINIPAITELPLISPLANSAFLSYKFDLAGIDGTSSRKVYKIAVKPIFPEAALFSGFLWIEDETFALKQIDLSIQDRVMPFFDRFRWEEKWTEYAPEVWTTSEKTITTFLKSGKDEYSGKIEMSFSNYETEDVMFRAKDPSELKSFAPDAFDQDSAYWSAHLPFEWTEYEADYRRKNDSLRVVYASDEFLSEKDSAYNKISFWDVTLSGVGLRNRKHGLTFFINPLIVQAVPAGIGGYRHRLGGTMVKKLDNDFLLETEGQLDYGFRTRDVKGKAGIGLTYYPKKFVRTFIRFGDNFELINNYASVGSLFARSNYVREKSMSIAQRIELVNGLFAELFLEYSDQQPLQNTQLEGWSNELFGSLNRPADFDPYTKVEIKLIATYRFKQPYYYKKNQKIIQPSKYPELRLTYRKGLPHLLGSEVNFDFIEIGAKHEYDIPRFGSGNWSVQGGAFINKRSLRLLEHKYFRGSDPWFFSDPLSSFQLLGPTLSTSNSYYRGGWIHHFNGLLLNKIPLLNRLRITELAGVSYLAIPSQGFFHQEYFAGLEWPFRIKEQYFRLSAVAVTADSSIGKAQYSIKFGLSYWDTYRKRWNY